MSMKAFLRQNAIAAPNRKLAVSSRFVDDKGHPQQWELRPISEDENTRIKDNCTSKKVFKGRQTIDFNSNRYLRQLCAKSVVFPDLSDAELQKSYGVIGEEDLLGVMLLPGEFTNLMQFVQEANGFDADGFEEAKNEVKNS